MTETPPRTPAGPARRPGRLDRWAGRVVQAAGLLAALAGVAVIVLRAGAWAEARWVVVDAGVAVLLVAGGASFVLEGRGAWFHVVWARLVAVLAALPAVVVLLSFLRQPGPVDLTLPAVLLLAAVGVALLVTLSGYRAEVRLGSVGVLAAFAFAVATVTDLARLLFGEHPDVFSPLPRFALVGLALIAAGLVADTVRRSARETGLPFRWLPVAVGLFLATFAVGLWSTAAAIEQGRAPGPPQLPLSAIMLAGGLVLAALAGLAIFLTQASNARLLAEARRLRGSDKRYRELAVMRSRAVLAESEARYRDLFETMPVGVLQSTLDGEMLLVNPALVEILGYDSVEEVLGLDLLNDIYVDPADRRPVLETLGRDGELRDMELRFKRKDGSIVVTKANARLVTDRPSLREPVIEGTLVDITAHKELEQRFVQAQKMEAIGQLAGGVAHDFNNLLTAIGGYAELALELLPEETRGRGEIAQIQRAADRATNLTRQLLAFSRQQVLEPEVVDIAELIADIESLLRRTLGEQVVLETRLAPDVGAVEMDPTQLEQVLLNLAVNARDAMPEGGRLEISAENVETASAELALTVAESSWALAGGSAGGSRAGVLGGSTTERAWVLIRVRDEGEGMDPETRSRAVDPFFTTKREGHGTGLGLSTVYGIVQQSGGMLEIESAPGEGTEVSVYLQCAVAVGESAETVEEERRPTAVAEGGRETILLVEDDPQVRDLVSEVLAAGGYRVRTAEDAGEAIALCKSGCEPDLVVTDVVMPGISGPDLVDELRRLGLDCRVLFMSGYSSEQLRRDHALEDEAHYLSKPFTPVALLGKIEEVLR